jgi:hypothetical protein
LGKFSRRQSLLCFCLFFVVLGYWGVLEQEPTEPELAARVINQVLEVQTSNTKTAALPVAGLIRSSFAEPFTPLTQDADKREFSKALHDYEKDSRPKYQKVDVLESFLTENPQSPWNASVHLNLGLYYQHSGRHSRCLSHLSEAWALLSGFGIDNPHHRRLKLLADRALGAYALSLSHFGRTQELEELLASVEGRALTGSSTEYVSGARSALRVMTNQPWMAFWCGPAALKPRPQTCSPSSFGTARQPSGSGPDLERQHLFGQFAS